MDVFNLQDFKGGWFIGNFDPSIFKQEYFEVGIAHHASGQYWAPHYHKQSLEMNYLVKGKLAMQDQIVTEGQIFVMKPWEIANPQFLEDSIVVIIKTPSVPGDKFLV